MEPSRAQAAPIELAEWPDLVLLVLLSASTLARLVHGLADTLLASTLMATGPQCLRRQR